MNTSWEEKQELWNRSCPEEKVKIAPTLFLFLFPEKGTIQNR